MAPAAAVKAMATRVRFALNKARANESICDGVLHEFPHAEAPAGSGCVGVEFEDEAEASGRGEPMRCPQRYVLALPQ